MYIHNEFTGCDSGHTIWYKECNIFLHISAMKPLRVSLFCGRFDAKRQICRKAAHLSQKGLFQVKITTNIGQIHCEWLL